ncbi:MAG: [protein-PII] uridylyltransferase [Deltaproteobacteria bacterium]|nr:[protein-PII] uridylyltransferase [Deltaproteobacteria bacterium]
MSLPVLSMDPSQGELSDRDFLERLKAFLSETLSVLRREEREALCEGEEACRRYSDAMDAILLALHDRAHRRFLSAAPDLKYKLAVVAVGGYGRRELCPKSDIDLLFLHSYKVDRYVEAMTEWMLYPLWDLGLDVGHSVRNVKETVRMAAMDDSIRTALLDYRFIAGSEPFFRDSEKDLEKFLFYADADKFIEKKIAEMRARHAKYGSTVYVLEPNVKEGRGGLRDLHTAIWTARVKYKCDNLVDLRNKGVLSSQTIRAIRHVLSWLLRLRNGLHYLTGKKTDVLTFEIQEQMAELFGYRTHGKHYGVERFMRSYYMHALSSARLADELLEEVGRFLPEGGRKLFLPFRRKTVSGEGILYRGKLNLRDSALFQKDPVGIMEFFRTMQKTHSALSVQARLQIQRALPMVGREFREDPRAGRLFLEILSDPHGLRETLLSMNECRFLGRYFPEFAPLYSKVQRDIYHVYTVDIHSIRAASVFSEMENAAARTREEEELLRIYRSVPRRDLLNLSILIHDIGKGKGHGHSQIGAEIAGRIGPRMGLTESETADIVFLVENHLLMAHTSQRRDLHDIELILWFADAVGSPFRLDVLYLLTYADLREVGPEVWTQWKAMLLAELYDKAKNVLETGKLKRVYEERPLQRREQVREWLAAFPRAEVDRYLSRFDDRYFLGTPDKCFADHLRLLSGFDGAVPMIESVDYKDSGASELIIVWNDQRGLFAKIAGTLSVNGINILNASISTSIDGVALDVFYVTYMGRSLAGDAKKDRILQDLSAVLRGETTVEQLQADRKIARFVRDKVAKYRPTRVVFDNSVSSRYTVVDIFTYDRIGLLYDITRTLTGLGIDIALSKISTKADQVADVFYLTDRGLGKIVDEARLEQIRAALLEAIGE